MTTASIESQVSKAPAAAVAEGRVELVLAPMAPLPWPDAVILASVISSLSIGIRQPSIGN